VQGTHNVLWNVDPLLDNNREIDNYTTAVAVTARKQTCCTATLSLRQRNGIIYAARAEMLSAGPVSCRSKVGLGTKSYRAGEDQQQFTKLDWLVSQWQDTSQ
jgi:hypothetical protein